MSRRPSNNFLMRNYDALSQGIELPEIQVSEILIPKLDDNEHTSPPPEIPHENGLPQKSASNPPPNECDSREEHSSRSKADDDACLEIPLLTELDSKRVAQPARSVVLSWPRDVTLLWNELPGRCRDRDWVLLYSTLRDGISLATFFRKVRVCARARLASCVFM